MTLVTAEITHRVLLIPVSHRKSSMTRQIREIICVQYLGAEVELFNEKTQMLKISWYCPFKCVQKKIC